MEHKFQELSPHILIMHAEHDTDRPILAAVSGSRRTLLMDAGNSPPMRSCSGKSWQEGAGVSRICWP